MIYIIHFSDITFLKISGKPYIEALVSTNELKEAEIFPSWEEANNFANDNPAMQRNFPKAFVGKYSLSFVEPMLIIKKNISHDIA